ncbi:hypothetical protein DVH24_034748 [Malus domestica]|uniref:Uncharacterized protein n=1 Tax=Malus domestica TaxID=3750 RepID=A0A498IWY1_MALDO|nr:hypothetical protein DVH24_034748 [Malus domestica]
MDKDWTRLQGKRQIRKWRKKGNLTIPEIFPETEPSTSRISISNIGREYCPRSGSLMLILPVIFKFKENAAYTQQEIDALRMEWDEYVDNFIPVDETLD